MVIFNYYAWSALTLFVPLLRGPFGCMMAGGLILFALSARATSAKASTRFAGIAFAIFTAGSVMIVKGIAEAYQR